MPRLPIEAGKDADADSSPAEFAIDSAVPQSFLPMVPYRVTDSARLGRAWGWPARTSVRAGVVGSLLIVRADRRRA